MTQLTLETANGRTVEVLLATTRIDFSDYVDLTELVTAASVPPAVYVAGTISLDYSDAEIVVAAGEDSKAAIVTDFAGKPLVEVELKIMLPDRDRLTITRGRAALLQLDFDLEASHTVDTGPTPATAVADHYILAEVHPIDEKEFRVRGPLVAVNEADMSYQVAIRPFHARHGDFGRLTVNVEPDTEFEVDGAMYAGVDGLRALSAAGTGTPTVAAGLLSTIERSFAAYRILGGTSVPGSDLDAVVGNVIHRDGNFLTVRGATVVPRDSATDRRVHFHDDVVVEVGPDTDVFRDGHRETTFGIGALSIGQRVTIRGSQAPADENSEAAQLFFDATAGAVRMHQTQVTGTVNAVVEGQADITLQTIDRRRASVFDFAGTGPTPAQDASTGNYEIATDALDLAATVVGSPISARGFPTAFGSAPPDFTGRTIIDHSDVRSVLGIAWGPAGTNAPFASVGTDGIVLALDNSDIGARHHVKQGPVLVDLLALEMNTTIQPRSSGRMLYSIKTADSLRLYSDFGEFVADLSLSLDGATAVHALHASGHFDVATNTLAAWKIGVTLFDPPL